MPARFLVICCPSEQSSYKICVSSSTGSLPSTCPKQTEPELQRWVALAPWPNTWLPEQTSPPKLHALTYELAALPAPSNVLKKPCSTGACPDSMPRSFGSWRTSGSHMPYSETSICLFSGRKTLIGPSSRGSASTGSTSTTKMELNLRTTIRSTPSPSAPTAQPAGSKGILILTRLPVQLSSNNSAKKRTLCSTKTKSTATLARFHSEGRKPLQT